MGGKERAVKVKTDPACSVEHALLYERWVGWRRWIGSAKILMNKLEVLLGIGALKELGKEWRHRWDCRCGTGIMDRMFYLYATVYQFVVAVRP